MAARPDRGRPRQHVLTDELIGDIADTNQTSYPARSPAASAAARPRPRAARAALAKGLNSQRYFGLVDDLDGIVDGPPLEVTGTWLRQRDRKRLAKADAELERP